MTTLYKVSGSGNDFLALPETGSPLGVLGSPPPETIRAWCRRGVSLGADGVFVLRHPRQHPEDGTVLMEYFNSDGYAADLCLNGTRCAAQLAFHLGWADNSVNVVTGAGPVAARRLDESRVTLELPAPSAPEGLPVSVDGILYAGFRLQVGVPHFVLPWPESLSQAPVETLGRKLREHAVFGEPGTNVNFVRFPGRSRMEIRTYERGVEAETLSCGSGVVASVAVGVALGALDLPVTVAVQGGFDLEVGAETPGSRWLLTGDARVVAQVVLLPGAGVTPAAPAWS
ncbi:MAG: diaminopimelate epimerase [Acidobacteriota bacterium]